MFPRCAEDRGAGSLVVCWRAICAAADLGKLWLVDFRYIAVSQAILSNEKPSLVAKLLGHRRHETTASLPHLADAHLEETAEKLGGRIAKTMNLYGTPSRFSLHDPRRYGRRF